MTGDRQTEAARAAWVNGGIAAKPEAAERRGGLPLCAARSHSRRRDQTAALEPKPPLPQRLAGRSGSGLVWHRARSEQQPGKPAGMSILVRDLSGFGGMLYPSRPTRTSRPSAGTTQRAPAAAERRADCRAGPSMASWWGLCVGIILARATASTSDTTSSSSLAAVRSCASRKKTR
jgi:hypothetical protein